MQLINGCLQLTTMDLDHIADRTGDVCTVKEALGIEVEELGGIDLKKIYEIGFTSDAMAKYADLLASIFDELRKMKTGATNAKI